MALTELQLGELEIAVLNWLWRVGELDAKTLHQQLMAERKLSLSTVQSTLERLYRKQLVLRNKQGHAYLYQSALSRAEVIGQVVSDVVDRFANGYLSPVLSSFIDVAEKVDERTLDELERLIQLRRAERSKAGS